jgi:hypothetical protein
MTNTVENLLHNEMSKKYQAHKIFQNFITSITANEPPAHAGSSLADFSTLKMEMIHSSETSVHTRTTQRHIPENGILHSHCCENLKSHNIK